MELPNLTNTVKENIVRGRKNFPCDVVRASSIGYFMPELDGCLRRGVYEQTRWQDKKPWEVESLIRFREGDMQERAVLRDLSDAGIDVIEQQSTFEWKEYKLRGHVDGAIIVDGKAVPLEIKSCAPSVFSIIHTWEDLDKKPWLKGYKAQITVYMLFKNIDWGILLFKDKSSGLWKQINVKLDYELGEAAIKTAEEINKHVAAGTLPDKITDIDTCQDCQFSLICQPDVNFGEPLKVQDDPEFEAKIDRYLGMKDSADDCKKLYDGLKEKMRASANNNALNLVVGKYRLTAKGGKQFRPKIETI